MSLLRRFGRSIALMLSAAGTLSCIVGIIGLWLSFPSMSARVQRISAGLDGGVERASAVGQTVQRAIEKARADLAEVRKESADLGYRSSKDSRALRGLRSLIQQQVGPNIDDLSGRLATLSDAAIAVSSVLQGFQELAYRQTDRINIDQLERWKANVHQLSATMRRLEGIVNDANRETSGPLVATATSAVDLALQSCQETLDSWQSNADDFRAEVQHVTAEACRWLASAAIAATVLVLWVAVGQVSLFAHALQWCRKA